VNHFYFNNIWHFEKIGKNGYQRCINGYHKNSDSERARRQLREEKDFETASTSFGSNCAFLLLPTHSTFYLPSFFDIFGHILLE